MFGRRRSTADVRVANTAIQCQLVEIDRPIFGRVAGQDSFLGGQEMDELFRDLPIWGLFVGTMLLVVASVEVGYRWARRRQRDGTLETEAPVGAMAGATLGLLAFLLAFTFGIAADAFHARKVALVNETGAIEMTYRLSSVIPEEHRAEIRTVLRDYVDERLRWANGTPDEPGRSAKDLLDRLWKASAAVGAQSPGEVDVFLGYVGRTIELQQERLTVRERSRIPGAYWAVLYIVAVLALSAVGYHGGVAGTGRSPVMLVVAIAFSAVILVIADLDRPGQGFINVSQQPMIDLRETLAALTP